MAVHSGENGGDSQSKSQPNGGDPDHKGGYGSSGHPGNGKMMDFAYED